MQHFLRARSFAPLKDDARALCFFINITFAWEREEQAPPLPCLCYLGRGVPWCSRFFIKSNFDLETAGDKPPPYKSVRTDSVIFSHAKYGVGRNKKYPTKEARLLFGYFLLCPTNLFVAKIMRGKVHYL